MQTTTLPGKYAGYNLNLSQFRQGQMPHLQPRKVSSFLQPMMNDLAQKARTASAQQSTMHNGYKSATASCYSYTCIGPPGKQHSEIKTYNIHQKYFLPKQVMEATHSHPRRM